jgi:hypothetical protein
MSAAAVSRSLRTYYAPGRAAVLDGFFARFLKPGDLAFDIGAHVGDRTAAFRRLGARAVAVEPQPPLARALYAHAELDREIPAALFSAVAQVLAWVFQLRNAMAGQGKAPCDLPELQVPPELDPQHRPAASAASAEHDE